jgi:hypothetical protein
MRRSLLFASLAVVGLFTYVLLQHSSTSSAAQEKGHLLSHDVYFTLKDSSPEAKKKLVQACKKYLSGHDGEVFFATGIRAESFKREVNDLDYDVALQIVFKSQAAHDKYQDAKRHIQFIDENKANWKKVRVFDSWVER